MNTKVAILDFNGKPIAALRIREMSANEFLVIQKQCEDNAKELDKKVKGLVNRVDQLESKNYLLENTVKYLLGEIDKEEYERVCGNK